MFTLFSLFWFLIFLFMIIVFCYFFLRTVIVIVLSVFADDPVEFVNRYGIKNDNVPPPDDIPNAPANNDPFLSSLATMALIKYLSDDSSAKVKNSSGLESSSPPDGPSENGFW